MMNPDHVRRFVIIPTLEAFPCLPPEQFASSAAVELLLGTALVESRLTYLRQGYRKVTDGRGVARSIYQMENATYQDLWRYISRHPDWVEYIGPKRPVDAMMPDMGYASLMARLNYWRKPFRLPDADDVTGLATAWKTYWNTSAGAGKVEDFIKAYQAHRLPAIVQRLAHQGDTA